MPDDDANAPSDRVFLNVDQAIAMLTDRPDVHTFRQSAAGVLLGADWERAELIEAIHTAKIRELAGAKTTGMGHGLVIRDDYGPMFVEKKRIDQCPTTTNPPRSTLRQPMMLKSIR